MTEPMSSPHAPGRASAVRRLAPVAASVAVVLVVVVLVAVFATRSGADDEAVTVPQAGDPSAWIDVVVIGLMVIGALTFGLLLLSLFSEAGTPRGTKVQKTAGGALLLVLLIAFATQFEPAAPPDPADDTVMFGDDAVNDAEDTPLPPGDGADDTSPGTGPVLAMVAMALATLVVAAALFVLSRRLTGDDRPGADADAAALGERRDRVIGLLDEAIEQLRTDPDPRRAVIAAWAHLEDTLWVAGMARRPSETPLRYLARVLDAVEASAPAVTRLTWAFERAMFSTHPIDRSTQLDAVDALVAVRDELHVASVPSRQRVR